MIEIFRIVKDALAGVARDDLVIAPDFLKYLGADPNLADFADFVTRCRNGDSAAERSRCDADAAIQERYSSRRAGRCDRCGQGYT